MLSEDHQPIRLIATAATAPMLCKLRRHSVPPPNSHMNTTRLPRRPLSKSRTAPLLAPSQCPLPTISGRANICFSRCANLGAYCSIRYFGLKD